MIFLNCQFSFYSIQPTNSFFINTNDLTLNNSIPLMLYHPYTLTLLAKFKETNDETLLKEILGLLIDSQPFTQPFTDFKTKIYNDFYKIIFSNSEIKKSKKQNIKKLNEIINTQFHKVENDNKEYCYVLNDFEGINLKGKQLIKKNRRRKSNLNRNESVLDDVILDKKSQNINEILTSFNTICDLIDCDKIYNDNKNLLTNITSKLMNILSKMQENGIITKKEYLNIIKDNKNGNNKNGNNKNGKDNHDTPKKLKVNDTPNLSLLNFLTKEKKINNDFDNDKNFKPIIFDSSVYVYKLNNPNFESLRKRKDLVNPKKMMFIKFTEDIKPPIYKPTENKLKHKISYQKIFNNVDYDEESTWEDDPDAESIDSVETEEDDSSSENNEFIEADSGEQERIKIKKPTVNFPSIKVEFNEEFDKIFWELPLKSVKEISNEIKIKLEKELKKVDESQNFIKRLSKKYMVVENSVKEVYEAFK